MKHAICYTCDENIPEEAAAENKCPECGGPVADRWGKVMIVESERRQTDEADSEGVLDRGRQRGINEPIRAIGD